MIRRLILTFLLLGGVWLGGLIWFAGQLPGEPVDRVTPTDAIIVLTGGSGRLQEGFDLLTADLAHKLFISGVYRGVEVRELLEISRSTPEELRCCIALGYEADNTRGNALESRRWLQEEGYNSLRLVTASYHMPRSLLEFRRAMPEVEIVPHPFVPGNYHQEDWWLWPGSARLLISEYHKYLVALLLSQFDRLANT